MVESSGPPEPPLTMKAWVNDWKALIICMTKLKKMIGEREGRVMAKNWRTLPAPSTLDAS